MLGALFGFGGRLSRPGYWEVLMSIVLIDVALVIGRMFVADSGLPGGYGPSSPLAQALLQAMPWVLGVFTLWSLLAAAIKRCHDRDRSGALVLVGLIPVIGWLWLLIDLVFLEGTEGKNRYGRAPHSPVGDSRSEFTWGSEPAAAAAAPASAWHDAPVEHADHGDDHGQHAAEATAHGHHDHGVGHAPEAHADHGHAAPGHDDYAYDPGDHTDGHDGHGHDDHGHEPAHAEAGHGEAEQAAESHDHAPGDSHGQDAHASASNGHDAPAPTDAHSH